MKLLFVLHAALVFSSLAGQEDWPQWRGPNRDGHVPASEKIITALPAEPKVLWKMRIGPGISSPIVAGDKVIYFDAVDGKETLHAINRETKEELWRAPIDETFHDMQGPDGPRNTPLVDGDRVYAVSCKGQLDCLNLADGKKIWGVNFVADFGASFIGEKGTAPGASRHGNNGTPLIVGDKLYACAGSTNGAGVVCFEKKTGKVLWKSQNDQAAYAPPAFATLAGVPQLLCYTADGLISLNPADGELFWRVPINTAYARHVTAPVWHDDVVVVSSHQVGMIGTRVTKSDGKPAADRAWLSREAAMNFASPVSIGNHLYGLGPRKNLECVEISTGKIMWSQEGYWQTSADKAYGGFLVVGTNILALTDTGQLVMFKATPEKFTEVGTAQVCAANWCNPAYADGKLYLRDGNKGPGDLICLSLE